MWTRAQLKEKGKMAFKRNYWKTVLISLLLALIVGGGATGSGSGFKFNDSGNDDDDYVIENFIDDKDAQTHFSEGAKKLFGISDSVEEIIDDVEENFENESSQEYMVGFIVGMVVTALVAAAMAIAIAVVLNAFIFNPLLVGIRRFFMTNLDTEAEAKQIAYGFDNNYKNTVKTMFFRDLYTFLWSLLFVIPGIVKAYQYRMIPYLLAENPNLTKDEAFAISKQMMNGQKWNAFVLDLSFIGWRILGVITFGIVNIFYVDPYKNMTDAALYEALKADNTTAYN